MFNLSILYLYLLSTHIKMNLCDMCVIKAPYFSHWYSLSQSSARNMWEIIKHIITGYRWCSCSYHRISPPFSAPSYCNVKYFCFGARIFSFNEPNKRIFLSLLLSLSVFFTYSHSFRNGWILLLLKSLRILQFERSAYGGYCIHTVFYIELI